MRNYEIMVVHHFFLASFYLLVTYTSRWNVNETKVRCKTISSCKNKFAREAWSFYMDESDQRRTLLVICSTFSRKIAIFITPTQTLKSNRLLHL